MIKKFIPSSLLLILLLFGGLSTVFAQSGTVQGVITDASNGTPLPGATVQVKGTSTGTITDIDGNYKLTVNAGATLVFSYIGYETQEIAVQPNTTVNVKLKPTAANLNELVVIGYGVEKKKDATGSVESVSADKFNKGANISPMDLLVGKVPGVSITTGGGAPGSGSTIRIRGGSSLNASNDPLIVVDGVPLSSSTISGARNPLNSINPEDIQSITVLKDASATAIYGSRASNGVIIITTKKGTKGQAMKVNFNTKVTFSNPIKMLSVYDTAQFKQLMRSQYPTHVDLLGNSSTNWQQEIYNVGIGNEEHVSLSGSTKWLPYRISVGHSDQNGILKTGNFKRTTVNASFTPSLFNDHLQVTLNVNGSFIKNRFANTDAIGASIQMDPTQPVYSNAEQLVSYTTAYGEDATMYTNYGGYYTRLNPATGMPVTQATTNPMALLYLRDNTSKVNQLIGNLKLDYKFHFLPALSAHMNLAMDHSSSAGHDISPIYASFHFDPKNGGGYRSDYTQTKKNDLFDFYMDYNKDFKNISSHFNLMAGYSWQHFYTRDYSEVGNWYHNYDFVTYDTPTEYYLVSYFGRLNYSFKDKYLLTVTVRNDGSSRFSPTNRWGLFPSAAFAWRISEEPWMKSVKVISHLKLRLSYGVTGQQNITGDNYPYLGTYTYSTITAQYPFGGVFYNTLRGNAYNENIKWESTATYDAGLDYGFLQDRIYGQIDVYYRQTKDLIEYVNVPAGSNLSNYTWANIGNMEIRGLEFSVFGRAIAKKDLKWTIGFNATYNENKITKLTANEDPTFVGFQTGGISGGVGNNIQINSVGYARNSFFVYQQVYDKNGKPIEGLYVDRNHDGVINALDLYHDHNPDPNIILGISSSLDYKNWNFSFSGRANLNNYVYNNVNSSNAVYSRLYRPEGPYLSNITTAVANTGFVNPQYLSDYYIQNASFFKMDNISLSYTFPNINRDKSKSPVSLRLSATVNNAFVITNYNGLDPEVFGGIDNNIYPRPRIMVFGLNLNF